MSQTQQANHFPALVPTGGAMLAAAARLLLPALWLGLIIGISLIEAPLKFTAPGITIPLGLGIGRLVFGAMNILEVVLFIGLLAACIRRGVGVRFIQVVVALGVVLLAKVAVIRPLLNKRTDAVLAGTDDGGSLAHYFYIAADGLLILLLVTALVLAVRRWVVPMAPEHR
ncbi:hypothetical protein [Paeniglutamicibacter cryotolerans]|uniref:Uncharacterized protein n=1 Tax=Paeniglutamicibacter cryotolerans TaxID=670079 RepID=A0A839QMN3_9MICC|nr:hypothetical protein [Paeniglutamicibacter cryotolerans]MBB2994472.1 hypothetical protein [Paeniglutamicibacter cryotolerans]